MPFWRRLPVRGPAHRLHSLRRPSSLINAVLAALLVVAAVLSYRTVAAADTTSTGTGTGTTRTIPVSQGQVTSSVSASGTVQSAATAAANFANAGTVTEIDVKVGDAVTQGQVLAKVNPTTAQEQLTAAQANLTSAQRSLTRAQSATTVDAATVASAEAQVTTAQNSVNAAQRAVDGTTLTAPMDGTVIAVNGTVGGSSSGGSTSATGSAATGSGGGNTGGGNTGGGSTGNGSGSTGNGSGSTSSSGTGFIQLADLTQMQVSASFAEADATRLKADQAATVTWAALSGARVTGRIATISPTATVQNNVNSYAVTMTLDSKPGGIRIGQTVTVLVTVAEVPDAVRVPAAAVRGAGQRHTVEVVAADGKREVRTVEVGVQGDQFVEITSGLDPGERVAITIQSPTGTTNGNRVGGGGFPGGGVTGGGGFTGGGNRGNAGNPGGNRGTG